MIAGLKGKIFEISDESVIVDVSGVYYEALCSVSVLSELSQFKSQPQSNNEIFLFTYHHVREDISQLFGFLSQSEKSLFLNLLKVSGIGPKSALHILSGASVNQILTWIEEGDSKALSKLPKLGKKTAEQLVLTLRGKLIIEPLPTHQKLARSESNKNSQVASALINLGFKANDVERVVSQMGEFNDLEEGIRQGLRELSQF